MTRQLILAAALLLSGLVVQGTAGASVFSKEQTPDEQRAEIRKVRDQTLEELYRVRPEARNHIPKSAGYAVFGNFGVKKFRLVWVFEKKSDLDRFVNSGWEPGAQTTASAKVSGQGANVLTGAFSVSPGVWLYQLTDDGLVLELTAKGTKYYKDVGLN
jgi:hypothetical protein